MRLTCFLPPTDSANEPQPTPATGAAAQELVLWRVWDALNDIFKTHPEHFLEAKTWLLASLAHLKPSRDVRLAAFRPSTHSADDRGDTERAVRAQLLRLWLETRPSDALEVLLKKPEVFGKFFESRQRILLWFSHFSMEGLGAFRFGARALARYALTHRDQVWQHLVWEGKHPQAPVTVATKTHYFCELDVVASVRQLLAHCPEFLSSEEFRESVAAGDIVQLDMDHWCRVLQDIHYRGGRQGSLLEDRIEQWITTEQWSRLCHRTLHMMTDEQLLRFLASVSKSPELTSLFGAGSPVTSAADIQQLQGLVLAEGAVWGSVPQVVLTHALAVRRRDLLRLLVSDEDLSESLADLCDLATEIHPPQASKHAAVAKAQEALVSSLRPPQHSASSRQLIALHAWTLGLSLHLHALWRDPGSSRGGGDGSSSGGAGSAGNLQSLWQRTVLVRVVEQLGGRCDLVQGSAGGAGSKPVHGGSAGGAVGGQYELLSSDSESSGSWNESDSGSRESGSDSDSGSGSDRGHSRRHSGRSDSRHKRKGKKGKKRKRHKDKRKRRKRSRRGDDDLLPLDAVEQEEDEQRTVGNLALADVLTQPSADDSGPRSLTQAQLQLLGSVPVRVSLPAAAVAGLLQAGRGGTRAPTVTRDLTVGASVADVIDVLVCIHAHNMLSYCRARCA